MSNKKTKIVATLGPATSNKETLKAMLDEGANVFLDQYFSEYCLYFKGRSVYV